MRIMMIGLMVLLWTQPVWATPVAALVQVAGLQTVDEPQPAIDPH
jgi:hypothetical protein